MSAAGESRDVVLAPPPADAPAGVMPVAGSAAGARSAGGSSTVLLSRVYGEDKAYTQVSAVQHCITSWCMLCGGTPCSAEFVAKCPVPTAVADMIHQQLARMCCLSAWCTVVGVWCNAVNEQLAFLGGPVGPTTDAGRAAADVLCVMW
jgi:hypothetical protein